MRTTSFVSLFAVVAGAAILAGCTVKDVDAPALAGPSTTAHSIIMTAERDTLTQNGTDFTDIRIVSLGPDGQSETIPLRAQIYVDGAPQDYGTLSTKSPVTPTTIRYTAPPASTLTAGQIASTVTIAVTPVNAGDARGEISRQVDIRLEPFGIILPVNPSLAAAFTVTPPTPLAGQSVTFDASTTTNNGSACRDACTYLWNFGDGATGTGLTATHTFSKAGNYAVTLTVTDARGASTTITQTLTVGAPTPPVVSFTMSPTPPAINVDTFFNASGSTAAAGRTIVSYNWDFGDGSSASGVAVAHKFTGQGTFTVVLTVTDDAGAVGRSTQNITLGTAGPQPIAVVTATPTTAAVGTRVSFDASASTPSTGSTIATYRFDYGDGSTPEVVANPIQSHVYFGAGTFIASVEVTDTNGKTAQKILEITITP